MFRWVIPEQLARGPRPGYKGESGVSVAQAEVDRWIQKAKAFGILSIICLLGDDQLRLYSSLPTDLISYYRKNGFHVDNIRVCDHQTPPVSETDLRKVWEAYKKLQKPILLHCSAGVDRTGSAIKQIEEQLERARSIKDEK